MINIIIERPTIKRTTETMSFMTVLLNLVLLLLAHLH